MFIYFPFCEWVRCWEGRRRSCGQKGGSHTQKSHTAWQRFSQRRVTLQRLKTLSRKDFMGVLSRRHVGRWRRSLHGRDTMMMIPSLKKWCTAWVLRLGLEDCQTEPGSPWSGSRAWTWILCWTTWWCRKQIWTLQIQARLRIRCWELYQRPRQQADDVCATVEEGKERPKNCCKSDSNLFLQVVQSPVFDGRVVNKEDHAVSGFESAL